ncbi:hypothetical protein EVJ29_15180 [Exiguobacterium sp. SH4S7]|uniref:hypothetical protein n=1 Tax=Exiguobacterium sp. SH4S7 TaxID=2510958 RepID=UPI00103B338A|nr:hypothetical protein [Exiguobacterium sp. SH4S7]TCI32753.1 hypothetical protein EVJ29_15180 [Exiguobacterium sp. SH4S7]
MNLKKYESGRTFFIHYACGNFLVEENPTISAIAIRPYGKTTEIFSLAKEARLQNVKIDEDISPDALRRLERDFLKKFYDYVKPKIQDEVQWIHWNMVNTGYSWRKINERISQLSVDPNPIEPNTKDSIDLSEVFQEKYDEKFIEDGYMLGHTEHITSVKPKYRKGKLYNLAVFNGMMRDDFLSGTEEYKLLLKGKDFLKIQHSTARKVEFIENFFERDIKGNLKVQKNASISTRIKRKLIQNPLISLSFAVAISFIVNIIPTWINVALGITATVLTVWWFIKED